jgi:hypothetical protein
MRDGADEPDDGVFVRKDADDFGAPLDLAVHPLQRIGRVVVETEASSVAREIERGSVHARAPLEALRRGAKAYFAAMSDPARAQLMLVDGPAVLGPQEMRRIDLETGGAELRPGLAEVLRGRLGKGEIEARADLLSAMFDRAALARANGAPKAVYERAMEALVEAVAAGASSR